MECPLLMPNLEVPRDRRREPFMAGAEGPSDVRKPDGNTGAEQNDQNQDEQYRTAISSVHRSRDDFVLFGLPDLAHMAHFPPNAGVSIQGRNTSTFCPV